MATDPLAKVLQRCSFHAFLMIASTALSRSGFGDVEILDRRSTKQKSRYGGHEMLCRAKIASLPAHVVVKVIQDRINTRMLDELHGCVDRRRADLGVIISPFQISPSVAKMQASYAKSRVEIIDADGLSGMLKCSGIGIRPKGDVDFAYFAEMEARSEHFLEYLATVKR